MTALQNYDQYIDRCVNGYYKRTHFCADFVTATSSQLYTNQRLSFQIANIATIGSLPAGVAGLRITNATLHITTVLPVTLGKLVFLGSYNYGTGVFSTGNAMPTETEGNVSRVSSSAIVAYALTQLVLSSGVVSTTVQYTDQDGNMGAAAPAFTFVTGAVAGSAGLLPLAAGDVGAQDITNVTVAGGGSATGTIGFFGFIPFGNFGNESRVTATPSQLNFITDTPTPPLVNVGDQLGLLIYNNGAKRVQGTISFVGEQP